MSQTLPPNFATQNALASKAIDYAFVIAGWPTIYTVVKDSYSLSGTPFSQFTAARAWASVPAAAGASMKGRPEEGGLTLGEMEIDVLDRTEGASHAISSLLSREADLRGPAGSSGTATRLAGDLSASETTSAAVVDASALPSSGVVYVGLECIHYASKSGNTLQTLTRGYRLTSPTRHPSQSYVYTFMPSLHRRKAYLYKGYQGLVLADWAPAWGGVVTAVEKAGAAVRFRVMSTTWHTYNEGERVMFTPGKKASFGMGAVTYSNHVLSGQFTGITVDLTDGPAAADLVDTEMTFLLDIGGELTAITGAL